jgi:hypothetical protein
LLERGLDNSGSGSVQAKLLDQQPDWGKTDSQCIELHQDRYHTCLIGAAYHAELASQEHRWRRLKQMVRPLVDGEMATTLSLVENAWPALGGTETFQDARSCRETAHAYQQLALAGTDMTHQALQAEYLKQKNNHRGVYDSNQCQLMARLDMAMTSEQKQVAATTEERIRLSKVRQAHKRMSDAKCESAIRSERNKVISGSDKGKKDAKERHLKCVAKVVQPGDKKQYRTALRPKKSKP